ncbi:hypothetical protein B0H13DRAFT_1881952 [Mycena leptocephala]|nr:hypothetical protein B0H13DRAFT_1881952 [Mycena leptocephala]
MSFQCAGPSSLVAASCGSLTPAAVARQTARETQAMRPRRERGSSDLLFLASSTILPSPIYGDQDNPPQLYFDPDYRVRRPPDHHESDTEGYGFTEAYGFIHARENRAYGGGASSRNRQIPSMSGVHAPSGRNSTPVLGRSTSLNPPSRPAYPHEQRSTSAVFPTIHEVHHPADLFNTGYPPSDAVSRHHEQPFREDNELVTQLHSLQLENAALKAQMARDTAPPAVPQTTSNASSRGGPAARGKTVTRHRKKTPAAEAQHRISRVSPEPDDSETGDDTSGSPVFLSRKECTTRSDDFGESHGEEHEPDAIEAQIHVSDDVDWHVEPAIDPAAFPMDGSDTLMTEEADFPPPALPPKWTKEEKGETYLLSFASALTAKSQMLR